MEYYTPSLEDICVGYECQIRNNASAREHWLPEMGLDKLDKKTISDIVYRLNWEGNIRTPYLAKEQILEEGWKVVNEEVKPAPYKVHWIVARKGDYEIAINLAMVDSMLLTVRENGAIRFQGQCKSINEFRKIMNWLKIK